MDACEFEQVDYGVADHVATVTLNRPDRRNAWTGRMAIEYRWALHHAEHDSDIGAIVVTGAERAFCVGADMEILLEVNEAGGAYQRLVAELPPFPAGSPPGLRHNHTYPLSLRKPVVAAINGPCAGAGFVVACFADLRIAAEDVKITPSFAGLGLPAEYGTAWLLPRIVGLQNALEMLLTNAVMTGQEALEFGFVRRCWPKGGFLERVQDFARNIARHSSPSALAVMKRQLYVDANGDLETAYLRAVEDMNRMVGEPDYSTGLAAVTDRRRPVFRPAPAEPAKEES
ncbi:MAG TPA: enoyl-CoA hydratase-related protein [Jatrophihabitantaceae bacterium]|nr:enoyl-CoA hydratase-related protein [Jatrophihabitantaceae bacterium]